MAMSDSPWGWTPYGGCDYYGGPQLANRAPWVFVEMPPAYEHIPSHAPGPGSAHDHVQRTCGNVSMGSNDSDSTYWNIHTYQMPDHVQETCNTDFTSSDDSDDCYWSVHTFPVSSTNPHLSQAQPSIHDGIVGHSRIVPPKAEYHEMQVRKVSNPILGENTFECVPSANQSQICETQCLSPEQQRPAHLDKRSIQQISATVEEFTPMGIGTFVQQQHDVTNIDHTAAPKPIFSKLLEEGLANKDDNNKRAPEAQRKHEQDEWQVELDHFFFHAFDLFEEDPESGAIVETIVGLDLFCDDAFELFDPGIGTSEQQFSYALPFQYLQQLQQHKTCQPVVSADCALLANNPVMSLQTLQLSKLLVNEFEGSADCANQLVIPGDIHNTTVHSLSQEIFYIGKPAIRYSGFIMPLSEEQQVIPVKGTCASATVPVPTRNEGCEIKNGLLLLHYSTPKDKPLLSWDPGEHETFVRFIDTSGTTCRLKFLMFVVNWHFVNLKEFEGSGDCTSKDHQLQARRICSSYSLAGSLGEHSCRCDNSCNCSLIILKWVTASASVVLYLRTCTLSLLKSVSYLSINLLSKGVLMVSVLYSSIVLQVLQTTYISLLDMNAQGDFHATDCYRLSLHEFSAIIFALFKVCINIWGSADTRATELTGNVVDTYSRLFATALLQVEMCIVLDFLQIFDSIVHVLYITKVEKSPTAQNEQVQMGKIAKYMHWTQCSDFIYLKDFLMNNDSSLRWFPSSKRTFSQWDPGIEVSMHIHKILNCSTTRVFKWNQVLVKESIAHASVCFKCKTTGCPTDSIVWGHTETSTDLKQTRYYEFLMSKLLAMWLLLWQYLRFWEIDGWLVTYQPP